MKRLSLFVVLAVLALAAGTAWAAFEQEGGPYATGADPYAVYAADFTGDGVADAAVLNGTSSNLNMFTRQAGGFVDGGTIAGLAGPSFAAVGDYNGDGRADLAVANFVGRNVSVLLQQPTGGLALESTPGGGLDRLSAIGAGDFNSDGRIDLVVARWDSSSVTLLLRNVSNDGFTTGASFSTGTNPRQIGVADFNGDDLADIAVVNAASNSVTVLLRSGSGFAAEGAAIPVGTGPQAVAIADFNGDSRPDMAVTNNTANTVTVLLRNGTNDGFAVEAGSPITVAPSPVGITTADFNVDGRPDLAIASGDGVVNILQRNAGGGFTAETPVAAQGAYGIATADFDGNGRPDLAVTSLGTNQLRVFRNPSPAQPPPTPTPTPASPVATPTPLPTPVAGRNVNIAPVEGKIRVKVKGSNRYVDLSEARQIATGATVDARKGTVEITAAAQGGTAKFYDGIFKISQSSDKKHPLTTLTLTETLSCPKGKKASSSAAKQKRRKLWGDGKGAFRTSGRYSAATVRGTKWLVTDTCTTTKTTVAQGSVNVRDFVKKKTILVRKTYTARKK